MTILTAVLVAITVLSIGCDRNGVSGRTTVAAEVSAFQVDGMRRTGDAL